MLRLDDQLLQWDIGRLIRWDLRHRLELISVLPLAWLLGIFLRSFFELFLALEFLSLFVLEVEGSLALSPFILGRSDVLDFGLGVVPIDELSLLLLDLLGVAIDLVVL